MMYLDDQALEALAISPALIVEEIENAVYQVAAGKIWTAPKAAVVPGDGRYVMTTLALSDDPALVAVKCAMVSPENPGLGLSAINATILLMHGQTGALLAVLGANWITAVRTAGLSAVMAKRLANPKARAIGFIGTGVQARSHLAAFAALFPLEEVWIFGRGRANIDVLAADATARGLRAQVFDDPRAALETADIVVSSVTLNYDTAPFLDARWLKPGAFATITDLAIPWIDAGMTAFDSLYVDDRAQEAAMDKPMVAEKLISGDLGTVVTGGTPAAFDETRRSAFVFRGLAIGDLAVAGLAYGRAMAAAD